MELYGARCGICIFRINSLIMGIFIIQAQGGVPNSTAEDSTAEDSTAKLYLPTTLRRSFSQNADSTAELEKVRTLRRSFSNNTYPTTCGP